MSDSDPYTLTWPVFTTQQVVVIPHVHIHLAGVHHTPGCGDSSWTTQHAHATEHTDLAGVRCTWVVGTTQHCISHSCVTQHTDLAGVRCTWVVGTTQHCISHARVTQHTDLAGVHCTAGCGGSSCVSAVWSVCSTACCTSRTNAANQTPPPLVSSLKYTRIQVRCVFPPN